MIDRESLKMILTNVALGMGVKSAPGWRPTVIRSTCQRSPWSCAATSHLRIPRGRSATCYAPGRSTGIVNECYRASFYPSARSGETWPTTTVHLLPWPTRGGQPFDKWVHYFPIYTRHLAPYIG